MALNVELLQRAVEWVREQEEISEYLDERFEKIAQSEGETIVWDQGTWFDKTDCGTAMCVAGWVVWQNGDRIYNHYGVNESGESIPQRAAELLGVEYADVSLLFAESNDADGIAEEAAALVRSHDDGEL